MALFGRDYDRDYGYRSGLWNGDVDRTYRARWRGYDRDGSYRGGHRYEPDMSMGRYDNMPMGRYDREFGPAGYDRGYKSRWQTDHGDPFGDRTAHTPMRVIRGEYHGGYDRPFRGGARRGFGYGRDYYEANPMGYDPYSTREGTWMRGPSQPRRTYGRGYDTGWF